MAIFGAFVATFGSRFRNGGYASISAEIARWIWSGSRVHASMMRWSLGSGGGSTGCVTPFATPVSEIGVFPAELRRCSDLAGVIVGRIGRRR